MCRGGVVSQLRGSLPAPLISVLYSQCFHDETALRRVSPLSILVVAKFATFNLTQQQRKQHFSSNEFKKNRLVGANISYFHLNNSKLTIIRIIVVNRGR